MDQILIEGLEIECIVGLRPLERRRRQRVRIDVTLELNLSHAAHTGRIAHTADYSRVADEIGLLLRFREYQLIEAATEEVAAMLLGIHRMVASVEIRIEKPEAMHGRARSASLRIRRTRSDLPEKWIERDYGGLTVLLETREAGLYLARVNPARVLPPLVTDDSRSLEWLLSGRLEHNVTVERNEGMLVFPEGRRTSLENHSDASAELFICRCPSLSGDLSAAESPANRR